MCVLVLSCIKCVYIQDPHQAVVQVGVHRLHVVQSDGFPQQLFVERQREAPVDVVTVKHRHAHDPAHEVEVRQMLLKGKERGPLTSNTEEG